MRTTIHTLSLITIALFTVALSSCTTTPKNCAVSLLDTEPGRPYQILGQTKISKYNTAGLMWQDSTVKDYMRQYAASLGGDAIMNVEDNSKFVSGTVIAYKQILV